MPNQKDLSESHMLNPDISDGVLEISYRRAAIHVLQLSRPEFCYIRSLAQTEKGFSITGRQITQNMNNMLQLANIPGTALPPKDRTYTTADERYCLGRDAPGPTCLST